MNVVDSRESRVLMVTPHYFPDMGGIETHVYEVGRRLVSCGVDLTILTTMPYGDHTRSSYEVVNGGMKVIRVPVLPYTGDLCVAPDIYALIKEGDWDLVHCQGCHTTVPFLAMTAARRANIPFIVTFHTGGHSSALRNSIRSTQWRTLRPLLVGAQHLVSVSHFEAKYFGAILRLPPERFTVIPNGAALPAAQRSLWEKTDRTLIVSIGRLERYKGHQHMITALPAILEQRPAAQLLILGAGPYESSLRKLAETTGVAEHVEIRAVPASDRQAMAAILVQASLVTLMSEYEAHPIAVMEALSLQCPVLGVHAAGLQELAEQGLIRTVPLHSTPEQVAAAALQQIEQPLIPTHFALPTWDECAEKLLTVYERVDSFQRPVQSKDAEKVPVSTQTLSGIPERRGTGGLGPIRLNDKWSPKDVGA